MACAKFCCYMLDMICVITENTLNIFCLDVLRFQWNVQYLAGRMCSAFLMTFLKKKFMIIFEMGSYFYGLQNVKKNAIIL